MYQIREVVLENEHVKRKRLIIEFDDPAKAIVGEFLMTDASLLNFGVLDEINQVLTGQGNYIESSGHRCSLEIRSDQTLIEDLFEGMFERFETLPAYEIDTKELRDLVLIWKGKIEALKK